MDNTRKVVIRKLKEYDWNILEGSDLTEIMNIIRRRAKQNDLEGKSIKE